MAAIRPSRNPFLEETAKPLPPVNPSPVVPSTPSPSIPVNASVDTSLGSIHLGTSAAPQPIAPQILAPDSKRQQWWLVLIVLLLIGFVAAGFFFWFRESPVSDPEMETIEVAPEPAPGGETPTAPEVTGEEVAPYTSESFKVGEIVIGGEAEFFLSEDDIAPLSISGIRGEAFTEKNKQEVKLVVTWKTNRLSLATIEYSKGVGQTAKTISENDYSFNHSVIITGLDPATTYLYTIKTEDRFGNVSVSEPHAVFTGARTVSLFDLIAGAIGDVFGWAVDK